MKEKARQRREEEEKESLYKTKPVSYCDESSEEDVNAAKFQKAFPSFHSEFRDLIPAERLEDNPEPAISEMGVAGEDRASAVWQLEYINSLEIVKNVRLFCHPEESLSDARIIMTFLRSYQESVTLSNLPETLNGEFNELTLR